MLTTRLAATSPADDDAAILRSVTGAVAGLDALPADVAAERYELGLRNEDGKIYRYLEVGGMPMVFAITEALRGFGFTPEPGAPEAASAAVSRIVFSRPPAILPFGFARRRKVLWRNLERPAMPGVPATRVPARPGA